MTKKTQRVLAPLLLVVALTFWQLPPAFAASVLVFSNEVNEQNANKMILDNDNTTGNVDLVFGASVNEYLRHDGTLFHFSDDVRMATTHGVEFRDSALKISSSVDGQLDIDADVEVEITATTVDLNGILDVSGNTAVGGTLDVTSTIEAGSSNITITTAEGNIDGEIIAADTIDDDSIDFGMGANQVGADDITVTDEFDNSDSTNVQDVLDDLDAAVETRAWKNSSRAATTAAFTNCTAAGAGIGKTLTNNGAAGGYRTIATEVGESVALTVGNRVLIKNQAAAADNGVYTITAVGDAGSVNWVLTRATDADASAEFNSATLRISEGTVNANTTWSQTTYNPTVDTNNIVFVDLVTGSSTSSLDEATSATDSGAYTVGVFDDFGNATTSNVQAVLKEFDTAISAAGGHLQNTDTGTSSNIFTLDNDDTGGNVDLIFGTTVAQYLRHDGTLFHFSDDVRMATTHGVEFRDSALKISSSVDGQLDIDADVEVEITATTVDLNGILDVSGNTAVGGTLDVVSTIEAGSSNITITTAEGNIDGEIIAADTIDDDSIDWVDVTSTDITFDADTVATTAVFSGTTSLEETAAADDSGAAIVGAFDEFDNSAGANVQDVLDDIDAAVGVRTYTNDYVVADAEATATSINALDTALKVHGTSKIHIPINNTTVLAVGGANLADIYADSETGINPHEYYLLKTTQAALQDLDLKIKVKLPEDFGNFTTASNDLSFYYKNTGANAADSKVDILIEDVGGDDAFTAADGQGLFNAAWTQHLDEFDGAGFNPGYGEYLFITVKGYASYDAAYHSPYIGEIVLTYTARTS